MRIQICGSMTFAKEMKKAQKKLEELGHTVTVPTNTQKHIADPTFQDNLSLNLVEGRKNKVLKKNFDLIAVSDAILVLNYSKNNIDGYVGASTLMEIGLAHYLGKKVFLFNKIPHYSDVRWAHELEIIQPVIINQDLTKII